MRRFAAIHIYGIALAMLLALAAAIAADQYVRGLETGYVHTLGTVDFDQKTLGTALQRTALEQPDMLLLYGSSEVTLGDTFASYPTGFNVFRVGGAGSGCLLYAQSLAGLGRELRGKKVVISMSPYQFYIKPGIHPEYYAGNFSRLHSYELAFSTDLSLELKRDIARRMLDFPSTWNTDPFLAQALKELADGSPFSLAVYYATIPLGRFRILLMDLQDHAETLGFVMRQPKISPTVYRKPASIDWSTLARRAEHAAERAATNNPFGFENDFWDANGADLLKFKGTENDDKFRARMAVAKEWTDLELLMRTLKELGAEPLLLSTPLPGMYFDFMGISGNGRAAYYTKLEGMAKSYGMAVVDFSDYDNDKFFLSDRWSHPSPEGTVFYQKALDDFYHSSDQALR